jgi:hypothetical protein
MSGITCAMRPFGAVVRDLERVGVDPRQKRGLADLLNEVTAVDALANLLERALVATTAGSGNLDLRAVAAFVLRELKEHQL